MAYENISAELADDTLEQLIQKVKEMDETLSFTVYLSPEERQSLQKMGDKTLAFVEKALEMASDNPDFKPPYLDTDELQKDLTLAKKLKNFLNFLAPFYEKVDDTYLAVGSEAYAAARVFYYSAKGAAKANVPGADAIVKELARRYNPRAQSEEKEKAA